jgi:hypothetical protein
MERRALSTAISTFLATSATLWTAAHLFRRAARSPLFAMEDDMGLLDGILGGVIGAEALSLVKDYIEKRGGIQGVVLALTRVPQMATAITTRRTLDALWDAIGIALDDFPPQECLNYFRNAGYGST